MLKFQSCAYVWTFSIVILCQRKMICHQTKLTLFAQNHFQDCPQYPLSCEECGKAYIPRNEVSPFLLERYCTLSDLHLCGPHKWTVLFACTDWLDCRRKVNSFAIFWCSEKNLDPRGLGYINIIIIIILLLINWLLVVCQQWMILIFLFSRCKITTRKSVQGRSSSVVSVLWAVHLRYNKH